MAISEQEAVGPITVHHNGWEHSNRPGARPGWTCCSVGKCNCGKPIDKCTCGLHFKTAGGIVVG